MREGVLLDLGLGRHRVLPYVLQFGKFRAVVEQSPEFPWLEFDIISFPTGIFGSEIVSAI